MSRPAREVTHTKNDGTMGRLRLSMLCPLLLAASLCAPGVSGAESLCTSANVFMYHQRKLYTPALGVGLLEGVTRRLVIDLASKHGFEVEECDIFPEQLWTAHEVMFTSTLKEVMPVVQIGDAQVSVGKPGPVAKKLREIVQAYALEQVNA